VCVDIVGFATSHVAQFTMRLNHGGIDEEQRTDSSREIIGAYRGHCTIGVCAVGRRS